MGTMEIHVIMFCRISVIMVILAIFWGVGSSRDCEFVWLLWFLLLSGFRVTRVIGDIRVIGPMSASLDGTWKML